MKVILTENISTLGQIGDTITVAPGYARNYLIPKGLAMLATGKNVRELEHKKRMLAKKREQVRQEMLSLAEKLNRVTLTMTRKVSEEDKLYGSVSSADIHKALEDLGFGLDKKSIQLDQPIKEIGEFAVPIRIDAQITPTIKVLVQKEAEE